MVMPGDGVEKAEHKGLVDSWSGSTVAVDQGELESAVELMIALTKRHQGNAVELARVLDVLGLGEAFLAMLKPHQIAPMTLAFQELRAELEHPSTKPR